MMKSTWDKLDHGEEYLLWDCDYCNLQSDINCAEADQMTNFEQAWHLLLRFNGAEKTKKEVQFSFMHFYIFIILEILLPTLFKNDYLTLLLY